LIMQLGLPISEALLRPAQISYLGRAAIVPSQVSTLPACSLSSAK
jgi:hypothetical protein